MKIVLILSGGMDSTTLLARFLHGGHEVRTLGFDYGQRHVRELRGALEIAEHYNVPFEIVNLTSLRLLLGGSALTNTWAEIPRGASEESMKATIVPNRNMIFLAIAAGYAITEGYETVAYAGHHGSLYPDCQIGFVQDIANALRQCHHSSIHLLAPFIMQQKTKLDVCIIGRELNVPFELTWSCYSCHDKHCGVCGACVSRKRALEETGGDNTEYRNA